jgi:hypothetical protein
MAHLRPEFVFRRGEDESIGAKLTLWGHTVVIDPSANNVTEAKVAACRRALELIQESNPDWLVPPQPIDGPTTPDWNWIWMLVGKLLFSYYSIHRFDGRTRLTPHS